MLMAGHCLSVCVWSFSTDHDNSGQSAGLKLATDKMVRFFLCRVLHFRPVQCCKIKHAQNRNQCCSCSTVCLLIWVLR